MERILILIPFRISYYFHFLNFKNSTISFFVKTPIDAHESNLNVYAIRSIVKQENHAVLLPNKKRREMFGTMILIVELE